MIKFHHFLRLTADCFTVLRLTVIAPSSSVHFYTLQAQEFF